MKKYNDTDCYKVVYDPDCGYCEGAFLNHMEVRNMLRPSYAGFSPGTILRDRTGQLFKVIFEQKKFKLIPA